MVQIALEGGGHSWPPARYQGGGDCGGVVDGGDGDVGDHCNRGDGGDGDIGSLVTSCKVF